MRRRKQPGYPKLWKRLGFTPEDTEFNRRAAAYAEHTRVVFASRAYQKRKRDEDRGLDDPE